VKLKATIRKQSNKQTKKKQKIQKKKQTTTQEHTLTAAARDLGTEPSGQLIFD
jgi:hypothetical protein